MLEDIILCSIHITKQNVVEELGPKKQVSHGI